MTRANNFRPILGHVFVAFINSVVFVLSFSRSNLMVDTLIANANVDEWATLNFVICAR
jgi:hypothetical protein